MRRQDFKCQVSGFNVQVSGLSPYAVRESDHFEPKENAASRILQKSEYRMQNNEPQNVEEWFRFAQSP